MPAGKWAQLAIALNFTVLGGAFVSHVQDCEETAQVWMACADVTIE